MNYKGFYNDLIAHPVYQVISSKAAFFQPLLAASVEFVAAFADAKAGEPNPDAIRMAVWKLMYWLQPTSEQLAVIQQMLEANGLASLYSLQAPPEVVAMLESQPNPFKFYAAILGSKFYQEKLVPLIFSGTSSMLGHATSIMGFAIKDAQAGLVAAPAPGGPPNSLQAALWLWMGQMAPHLTPDDMGEIQGMLDAANLGSLYTLQPSP